VKLTVQEARRFEVIQRLDRGEITTAQAAELVGRSHRQIRRILVAARERGPEALAHGNRGRTPANAIPHHIRQTVVELSSSAYEDFNDRHFRDMLEHEHRIRLSAASVRRIRRQLGQKALKTRRPPKKHRRRERRPKAGMLIQIDGSLFQWLGEHKPYVSLLIAIDDATNEIFGIFRPTEDCFGYLSLLLEVIRKRGIPEAIYSDRHAIFVPPKKLDEIEQQLRGEAKPTQFGRVAQELGIRIIQAKSPQAKGRVERAFGTLQDRLARELALHNITTLDDANAFLTRFLKRHNGKFSRAPQDQTPAWRQAPSKKDLWSCFAFQFDRVVTKDHTVSFAGACLDLPKMLPRAIPKKTVQIRVHLDGRITYWLNGELLGKGPTLTGEPSPDIKLLGRLIRHVLPDKPPPKPRATATKTPTKKEPTWVKPAPDHPWKRSYRKTQSPPVIPSSTSGGG
jgi:transposase